MRTEPANRGAVGDAVFRPSPKSNPALATDLEPVSVRMPPRFETIRATAKHHRTFSPWHSRIGWRNSLVGRRRCDLHSGGTSKNSSRPNAGRRRRNGENGWRGVAGCCGAPGCFGAILMLLWPGEVLAVAGTGAVGCYGNQALFNTAFNTKSL